jgi:hypothetical protein
MRRGVAISLVLVLGITACGDSADDGATTEAQPSGVVDEESALAVIEAAYELYNTGDLEAWIEVRNRGSYFATEEDRQEILDWSRDLYGGEMEAGARYEDVECVSEGLGEWPVADTGPVAGYYFTCAAPWASSPQDTAGQVNYFEWVVSEGPDGAVVAVRTSGAG